VRADDAALTESAIKEGEQQERQGPPPMTPSDDCDFADQLPLAENSKKSISRQKVQFVHLL